MRILIKKDRPVQQKQLDSLKKETTEFWEKYCGITPEFYVEEHDFSVVQKDGNKPSREYIQSLTDEVHSRYGEYGVDHIVLQIHENNWDYSGIWGTNWSNIYHSYHVHLTRWDKDNPANTFGTLYHEMMHSFDALVFTHTGSSLNRAIGMDWDKFIVHGGRPDQEGITDWKYIRHKENTGALKIAGPLLKKAYAERKRLHNKNVSKLTMIVNILKVVVTLLRKQLAKKDGVNIK